MKRVVAIFLTILYLGFLSGSLWCNFYPGIADKSFCVDYDIKAAQKSSGDDEIKATKYFVQSRHIASVIKIKISRVNVIASAKNNIPLADCYKLYPSNIINTSPCFGTSLVIKNCVFRI